VVLLLILALVAFGGGCVGYALCLWHQAQASAVHNEAIRRGVLDQYATMRDGRDAHRYEAGRYKQGE